LPNDDPEVFEHFVQWLYTGGYDFDDSIQTREDAKNENEDVQALEYSSPAIWIYTSCVLLISLGR
jgi:hypothetical protein